MSGMDIDDNKQGGGDLSKRQGLIAVNDLTYVLEPDLSVATNKTHEVHFFKQITIQVGTMPSAS